MFRGCSKSDNPHRRDFLAVVVFIVLFAAAIVLSHVYESEIASIGNWFLSRFDRTSIYIALFIVAALSSGLLPLPVWIYVVTCVALGASLLECSLTVGLGASLGSASS